MSKYNVGVDVGGTFTDVLLTNSETGELLVEKVLSTPEDQSKGVLEGLEKICEKAGISFAELDLMFHGTTVVTNMILEEKGAHIGFLTTKGHEQILHLARSWTPGPLFGWMTLEKPDPLADLVDTFGVVERIGAKGEIINPLDLDVSRKQIEQLISNGVESIAISLLNSYINPTHERQLRKLIQEVYPNVSVSISSDIVPEAGEYERTLTTIMNSYTSPQVAIYLNNLEKAQKEKGFEGNLNIVRSDGGTMSSAAAIDRPVDIAFSGPSGGVMGSSYLSELVGTKNVMVLDMGGTSTDVSLIIDNNVITKRNVSLGYHEFKSRTIDIHSVGAGGGSIAHLSSIGALNVGPQSAGADPGPASYQNGGTKPTVTDANVVLHRIPPGIKLGGSYELDEKAAREVIKPIAETMGLTIEEAAQGILDIANENMYAALRVVSIERGYDPRDFGLVAFGGAGPMHANALGKLMNTFPVIIPPTPGVMSAFGFLTSNIQNEFMETFLKLTEDTTVSELKETLTALQDRANQWLKDESVPVDNRNFDFYVDCRYYYQNIQIPCQIQLDELEEKGFVFLREMFEEEHLRQFGYTLESKMEIASIRVIGKGLIEGISLNANRSIGEREQPPVERREKVYFNNEAMDTPLYLRDHLQPGDIMDGPAVVLQEDSTIVIEPDYQGKVDMYDNIIIDKQEEENE